MTTLAPVWTPAPRDESCPRHVLRALKPVELLPEWRSYSHYLSLSLHRIEQLVVKKADDCSSENHSQSYTIQIYFEHPTSRIPTLRRTKHPRDGDKTKSPLPSRAPDMQVTHTLAQFMATRNSLHSCVENGHAGSSCDFCERLKRYLSYGGGRPMAFASEALNPSSDASDLLTRFLNYVLAECQSLLDSPDSGRCRGLRHVPHLLYTFIYVPSMN